MNLGENSLLIMFKARVVEINMLVVGINGYLIMCGCWERS